MRHGHNLQIRETREIDLAHENRDNIADTSNAEVGSSAISRLGLSASARAKEAR